MTSLSPVGQGKPRLRPFSPLLVILFLVIINLSSPARADSGRTKLDPEVEVLLQRISESQKELVCLEGRFTQKKSISLLTDPEVSSGVFRFREPDAIRLDYEAPNPVILLLAGDTLTNYYPDLKEAERFDVRKQKKRIFVHLLGNDGLAQLRKNFLITLVKDRADESPVTGPGADYPPAPDDETHHLLLTPRRRQLKRRLTAISLWVRKSDLIPLQYHLTEPNGDSTLFSLSQMKRNGELDEQVFRLELPADVRLTVHSDGGKENADE